MWKFHRQKALWGKKKPHDSEWKWCHCGIWAVLGFLVLPSSHVCPPPTGTSSTAATRWTVPTRRSLCGSRRATCAATPAVLPAGSTETQPCSHSSHTHHHYAVLGDKSEFIPLETFHHPLDIQLLTWNCCFCCDLLSNKMLSVQRLFIHWSDCSTNVHMILMGGIVMHL